MSSATSTMKTSIPTGTAGSTESTSSKACGGAGVAFLSFIVLWLFLWMILITFRPAIVRAPCEPGVEPHREPVVWAEPGRAFIVSLVLALIIMIIVWLFMMTRVVA